MARVSSTTSGKKRWTPSSVRGSGWFFILLGAAALFFMHAMEEKKRTYQEMVSKFQQLEKEKAAALSIKHDLALQIQSQSDPAWVEMVLKRNLGMVREGQVKVYFHAD